MYYGNVHILLINKHFFDRNRSVTIANGGYPFFKIITLQLISGDVFIKSGNEKISMKEINCVSN